MSNTPPAKNEDADFLGIPGSGLIKKSLGTAADVGDMFYSAYEKALTPKAPDPYAVFGSSTAEVTAATDAVTGGSAGAGAATGAADDGAAISKFLADNPMSAEELAQVEMPAVGGSFLSKAMPLLSLGAGIYGIYDGVTSLMDPHGGPALDASLGIASGVADLGAGVTGGAAALGAAGIGAGGTVLPWLAGLAGPVGIAAGLAGFDAYGDKTSRDFGWFTDEQGNNQSIYQEAAELTGDAYTGTHDYMASSWMGEDVGGAVGVLAGGGAAALTAAGTFAAGTVADVGIGAVAATGDLLRGGYSLASSGIDAIGSAGGGAIDYLSSLW